MNSSQRFQYNLGILQKLFQIFFQDIFVEYRFQSAFIIYEMSLIFLLTNYIYTIVFHEEDLSAKLITVTYLSSTVQASNI